MFLVCDTSEARTIRFNLSLMLTHQLQNRFLDTQQFGSPRGQAQY